MVLLKLEFMILWAAVREREDDLDTFS